MKEAAILQAQGEAEGAKSLAVGQASKTFIPYEASAALGALGSLRSIFGSEPVTASDNGEALRER